MQKPKVSASLVRNSRKAWERQAVKKPLFPLKFLYFPITTTQIKPFKKAVFLGCKFSLAENKL